ncbi:MAG: hypothetical protein Q4D04_12615, partial [Clostridia bacterium]|nr:hypothetical protein [Clostridia bacterium]
MKKACFSVFIALLLALVMCATGLALDSTLPEATPYVDYSSDRSAIFFNTQGYNQTVFFDFFYPFDPPLNVVVNNPIAQYTLDYPTYDDDGVLMVALDDLEKLYAPWLDFALADDALLVRHTTYTKDVVSGNGGRTPLIDYQKTVWEASISLSGNVMEVVKTPYEVIQMTTNRNIEALDAPDAVKLEETAYTFELDRSVTLRDGVYYLPCASFMTALGKDAVNEDGYLTVRTYVPHLRASTTEFGIAGLAEVEYGEADLASTSHPLLSRSHEGMTWGQYMDGVLDGSIADGYLWGAFYVGTEMLYTGELAENPDDIGENDPQVETVVNRVIPYCLYI